MGELSPGSLLHTVLVYAISEPGEWSAALIAEDLPWTTADQVDGLVGMLTDAGMVHRNSTDGRLYPSTAGKQALSAPAL
jgi:hypothetical protein